MINTFIQWVQNKLLIRSLRKMAKDLPADVSCDPYLSFKEVPPGTSMVIKTVEGEEVQVALLFAWPNFEPVVFIKRPTWTVWIAYNLGSNTWKEYDNWTGWYRKTTDVVPPFIRSQIKEFLGADLAVVRKLASQVAVGSTSGVRSRYGEDFNKPIR